MFKTTDGHINIATTGQAIWERFCQALGAPELIENPDYADRQAALEEPRRAQRRDRQATRVKKTSAEWIEHLQQGRRAVRADLHHRPGVRRSAGQASRHRAERDEEGQVGAAGLVGQPFTLSRTPSKIAAPPPELGEHTDEVLKEFGFKPKEIAALRKANAL